MTACVNAYTQHSGACTFSQGADIDCDGFVQVLDQGIVQACTDLRYVGCSEGSLI